MHIWNSIEKPELEIELQELSACEQRQKISPTYKAWPEDEGGKEDCNRQPQMGNISCWSSKISR